MLQFKEKDSPVLVITIKEAYKILECDSDEKNYDKLYNSYKRLMKHYHPDVNTDSRSEDMAKQINEAWDIIKKHLSEETTVVEETKTENSASSNTRNENQDRYRAPHYNDTPFVDTSENWYSVKLYAKSFFIPKICPYCLKQTIHKQSLRSSCTKVTGSSGRKTYYSTSTMNVDFFCCPEHNISSSLKMRNEYHYVEFLFKNQKYAELFSDINHTTFESVGKAKRALKTAGRVAEKAVSIPGVSQLLAYALTIGFFLLCAVMCDA